MCDTYPIHIPGSCPTPRDDKPATPLVVTAAQQGAPNAVRDDEVQMILASHGDPVRVLIDVPESRSSSVRFLKKGQALAVIPWPQPSADASLSARIGVLEGLLNGSLSSIRALVGESCQSHVEPEPTCEVCASLMHASRIAAALGEGGKS